MLCPRYPPVGSGPFKLLGILSVRVFRADKQRFWTPELVQWLQYMRWAGVEKMLIYESFWDPDERQRNALQPLIDCGYVE